MAAADGLRGRREGRGERVDRGALRGVGGADWEAGRGFEGRGRRYGEGWGGGDGGGLVEEEGG